MNYIGLGVFGVDRKAKSKMFTFTDRKLAWQPYQMIKAKQKPNILNPDNGAMTFLRLKSVIQDAFMSYLGLILTSLVLNQFLFLE